jgi:hypothetical protein
MNQVEIFKPGIAALRELADSYKDITINGVDDTDGYDKAKSARKELGDWRIKITNSGKAFREDALAYQREVIRQEKEHLKIITPIEDALKAMIESVDDEKKREERKILLPSRRGMLKEIEADLTDDQILDMDEKAFSEYYTATKMVLLERRDAERRAEEVEKVRLEQIEKAKEEASARAVEEERTRVEREKAEAERKAAEAERISAEEEARKKTEAEADQARREKNRRYKAWLEKNGIVDGDQAVKIEREGDMFILWRKADEITIK